MVSKNHFHSTELIVVAMNHRSTDFPPQYTMMDRATSHLQLAQNNFVSTNVKTKNNTAVTYQVQ